MRGIPVASGLYSGIDAVSRKGLPGCEHLLDWQGYRPLPGLLGLLRGLTSILPGTVELPLAQQGHGRGGHKHDHEQGQPTRPQRGSEHT